MLRHPALLTPLRSLRRPGLDTCVEVLVVGGGRDRIARGIGQRRRRLMRARFGLLSPV
jgi:hypothetical protein